MMMKKYLILIIALTVAGSLYFVIHRNFTQFNSTVSIKNTRWQKVHVQVRKGYNPDPYHNKLIFDQYLTMGQSRTFTVNNGDDILYRRDNDPDHGDGIHFTKWAYANCDDSSTCIVDNP